MMKTIIFLLSRDLVLESAKPDWILQVISVLLLFLWMELMTLLGRLPALGYYAIMFTTVLKNVIKVSMTQFFSILYLSFNISEKRIV